MPLTKSSPSINHPYYTYIYTHLDICVIREIEINVMCVKKVEKKIDFVEKDDDNDYIFPAGTKTQREKNDVTSGLSFIYKI